MADTKAVRAFIAELLARVPKQNLERVVIFGSVAFTLNGVDLRRRASDLDLFVSEEDYSALASYGINKNGKAGGLRLGKHVEAFRAFRGVVHAEVLERSKQPADAAGLRVAALEDLISWKRANGRPKDLRDLATVEAALRSTSVK